MLPLLAPLDPTVINAISGLFGKPKKQRMAGEGPITPEGVLKPGTPYLDDKGQLKIWAGPNYGGQTPEAYQKLTGQTITGLEAARSKGQFPAVEKAPGLDVPTATVLPPTNYPETSADAQKTGDPYVDRTFDILEKTTSYEQSKQRLDDEADRIIRVATELAEQGFAKGVERTRRETELERLRQWGALEQTRIAANLTGQALVAQSMYLSAVPNVSVIDAMNKGTATALAPFQFRLGVRGG